jgi:hypothetical protein
MMAGAAAAFGTLVRQAHRRASWLGRAPDGARLGARPQRGTTQRPPDHAVAIRAGCDGSQRGRRGARAGSGPTGAAMLAVRPTAAPAGRQSEGCPLVRSPPARSIRGAERAARPVDAVSFRPHRRHAGLTKGHLFKPFDARVGRAGLSARPSLFLEAQWCLGRRGGSRLARLEQESAHAPQIR